MIENLGGKLNKLKENLYCLMLDERINEEHGREWKIFDNCWMFEN